MPKNRLTFFPLQNPYRVYTNRMDQELCEPESPQTSSETKLAKFLPRSVMRMAAMGASNGSNRSLRCGAITTRQVLARAAGGKWRDRPWLDNDRFHVRKFYFAVPPGISPNYSLARTKGSSRSRDCMEQAAILLEWRVHTGFCDKLDRTSPCPGKTFYAGVYRKAQQKR